MQNGGMVALQIRDIPDDVRDVLTRRARAKGQSLQAYLREMVLRDAAFEDNLALLDSLAHARRGAVGTGDDVLDALDAARRDRPGGAT
jgi:plasmid stability protein